MSDPAGAGDWVTALDVLEERLRRQEAVAELHTDVLPGDELPEVAGPIPEALRPRAHALLERTRRVEDLVRRRLAAAAPRRPSYGGDRAGGPGTDHGGL